MSLLLLLHVRSPCLPHQYPTTPCHEAVTLNSTEHLCPFISPSHWSLPPLESSLFPSSHLLEVPPLQSVWATISAVNPENPHHLVHSSLNEGHLLKTPEDPSVDPLLPGLHPSTCTTHQIQTRPFYHLKGFLSLTT